MRAHILAGITITILLGAQAAYSQAAAESVLLNNSSATATVKAGSGIGNALNKASNKLRNQVQQTIAEPSTMTVKIERTPRIPANPASAVAPATKPAPATGALIISIQGGQLKRSPDATSSPTSK